MKRRLSPPGKYSGLDHQDGFYKWKALCSRSRRIAGLFVQEYAHSSKITTAFRTRSTPEVARSELVPPGSRAEYIFSPLTVTGAHERRRTRCSAYIWVASVLGGLFPSVSLSHIPQRADDTPRAQRMHSRKAPACSCQVPSRALRRHRHQHQRRHVAPFFHVFSPHPSPRLQTDRFLPRRRSARSLLLPGQNVGLS